MSKVRQFFTDSTKKIKVYPRSIAKAINVHGGGTVQDHIDKAVIIDQNHVTRIGADLVFENDITIKAGAQNILYYMVGDTGHLMIHGGNIGNSTAGYAYSLAGYKTIKLAYVSAQAYSVNAEATYAWLRIPVGVQFAGCGALATPYMSPNTPYAQMYNVSTGLVSNDGYLAVEVRGFAFVLAHTFAFNVLLFSTN